MKINACFYTSTTSRLFLCHDIDMDKELRIEKHLQTSLLLVRPPDRKLLIIITCKRPEKETSALYKILKSSSSSSKDLFDIATAQSIFTIIYA